MPRQELLKELQIREKELMDELSAIRTILGVSNTDIPIGKSSHGEQRDKVAPTGTPKGKMSWAKYVELILKEIGGKGKSKDVADAVCKANPKIDEARVLHAVRHHLSKLLKGNIISANKSGIQSEGYEYIIKQ